MTLHRALTLAATAALYLGGCATQPDDDATTVEQFSTGANLGSSIGSPVISSSTVGLSNDYQPSCTPAGSAPDLALTWTAPATGRYTFSTLGSSFDTVLELRLPPTGASLGCNDDSSGTVQSTVSATLSAGETIQIIVDGYVSSSGAFQLNIGGVPSSGLDMWLRADAGISFGSGTQVAQWADQSGQGRNGSMPTPARQPQLVSAALNGQPVVRFGGAQSLSMSTPVSPTTFTMFIVGKNSLTSESFSMILGPGGSTPNNQLRWENGTQALLIGLGNNLPQVTPTIGNTRVYHALSTRYDGGTMTVYRDGNQVSSNAFTTTGPWTLASVGSWFSTYYMVGDLAEVIIYERALSESERGGVNAYLRAKYHLP
ncbi:MAG TPA: LamG-like jellyroll fold domain-containing protein [Kofleriaceae bacterium]|jgi:hypothetical protein|nr:LamG-like jellyroll fold domain-containing protein [Kofleriaceae bacterium]